MSAIIATTRGGTCRICLEEFTDSDLQLTHEGGERHEGFHETCLKDWLTHQSICPLDRQEIDRSSLVSRVDLIRARLKTAMNNASLAACFGMVAAAIGIVICAGASRVDASAQITNAPIIVRKIAQMVAAIVFGTLGLGAAVGGVVIARAVGAGMGVRAAASAVGAVALASAVATGTEEEAAVGAVCAAFLGFMAATAGAGVDASNIGYGIFAGGAAPVVIGALFNRQYALNLARMGIPLLAGASAGLLSLIRG